MFTLFTGSYRALEKALVAHLLEVKGENPLAPVTILSPSGAMLARLQTLLAAHDLSLLNVTCLTFYGLADRLLASSAPPNDRLVSDPTLYNEVVRDLLEGKGSIDFMLRKEFRPAETPLAQGLPKALAGTLRDLRDSGVRVVDALQAALEGHLGASAPEAAPTLELYARSYEILQRAKLRTSADQLRRAAEVVPTDSWVRNQRAVFLYGFYDLTGVQLDLALAFAQHADARVYFPYESRKPAYVYAERLLNDPVFATKVGTRTPLPETAPTSPVVQIWNCSGSSDEVWIAAKKILGLAESGIPFDRVLLTARALGPYISTLRDVLEAHQIPYSTNQEEPVGAYPLIKTARQLISIHRQDFPITSTFDLLKSPYFNPGPGHRDFEVQRAEHLARHAGIIAGWSSWEKRLTHWSKKDLPSDSMQSFSSFLNTAQANETSATLLALLKRLRVDLARESDSPHLWSVHSLWARRLLETWLNLPNDRTPEEELLWKALLESLDGLANLDALERPVSRSRFLEVWEEKLDQLSLQLAPSGTRGVQVLDIMSARGLSFDAVLILGMNEKSFPRLIREDPFLSDSARGALSGALGCRLARKVDGYQEERLLFQMATDMASHALFLSYQRSDEEGKALIPSLYLHDLPGASIEREHLARAPAEKWLQVSTDLLTPSEMSIWLNREGIDSENLYKALGFNLVLYQGLRAGQKQLDGYGAPLGTRDGVVGERAFISRLLKRGISPDSLRDLAECPFRYFAGKILSLHPDQDVPRNGDLAADASGKLIHRILETFFRRLSQKWGRPLDPQDIDRTLQDVCQEAFNAFQKTAADLYPIAWKATQINILARLRRFLKVDLEELSKSGFIPTYFEEKVSGEMSPLGSALSGIDFHGRIDRVDLRQNADSATFRVVDYKTGRPSSRGLKAETAVLRGNYLQLPVYLALAGDWLQKKLGKTVEAEGAAFYNLADWERGVESPRLGGDFWDLCGKDFSENLAGLVSLIKQGNFYIRPSDDLDYCSWCEFSQTCRKEHKPSVARSENSPIRRANDERLKRSAP